MDARARFSSRKFWLAEQAMLMAFVLALRGQLTAEFSGVVSIVVGAYIGINGVVERAKIKANGGDGEV